MNILHQNAKCFKCEMFGSKLLTPGATWEKKILKGHWGFWDPTLSWNCTTASSGQILRYLGYLVLDTSVAVARDEHDIYSTSCFALLKFRKIDLDPKNKKHFPSVKFPFCVQILKSNKQFNFFFFSCKLHEKEKHPVCKGWVKRGGGPRTEFNRVFKKVNLDHNPRYDFEKINSNISVSHPVPY